MANWKFTDQYGTSYPALANSILALLIFDVPQGSSPVSGTSFSASLDLKATGKAMDVLAALTKLDKIPMSGTVTTTNNTLKVELASTDDVNITKAISDAIPLIGGSITKNAGVKIKNETAASLTSADDPKTDELDLDVKITIGSTTGTLVMQVPMSKGFTALSATFENLGISLSDLNFLAVGTPFSSLFPTTLPTTYYNPSTKLSLLSLSLTLYINLSPFSVSVSEVGVSIGITNIPLYNDALYLNPLAVWVTVNSPTKNPTPTWGLTTDVALYPYGKQTRPPSADPDFTFNLDMQMPTAGNKTFNITGQYENPDNKPVSTILSDLMNDATFDTGIGKDITLTQFEFASTADTATGTIDDFSVTVGMSSAIGRFQTSGFGIEEFSISVTYTSNTPEE